MQKIDEISSTKKTGETLIQAGMFAFERGAYPNAVQLFEESLEYIGPMTEKGGEVCCLDSTPLYHIISRCAELAPGVLSSHSDPTVAWLQAQIWLAMSYEACQRVDECIALYTKLETGHASMVSLNFPFIDLFAKPPSDEHPLGWTSSRSSRRYICLSKCTTCAI